MHTIFSDIITRKVSADIVYEDEHTLAFLDINPTKKGHTLVIPKKPVKDIFELDPDTAAHVMQTIALVSRAVKEVSQASGVNIISNNGADAGQVVFHLHFHILPRHNVEEFPRLPKEPYANSNEKDDFAQRIRDLLG